MAVNFQKKKMNKIDIVNQYDFIMESVMIILPNLFSSFYLFSSSPLSLFYEF